MLSEDSEADSEEESDCNIHNGGGGKSVSCLNNCRNFVGI